jgi:hypothetical protein
MKPGFTSAILKVGCFASPEDAVCANPRTSSMTLKMTTGEDVLTVGLGECNRAFVLDFFEQLG